MNTSWKAPLKPFLLVIFTLFARAAFGFVSYWTNIIMFWMAAVRYSWMFTLQSLRHRALWKPYRKARAKVLSIKCCLVLISLFASGLSECLSMISKSSCRMWRLNVRLWLRVHFKRMRHCLHIFREPAYSNCCLCLLNRLFFSTSPAGHVKVSVSGVVFFSILSIALVMIALPIHHLLF